MPPAPLEVAPPPVPPVLELPVPTLDDAETTVLCMPPAPVVALVPTVLLTALDDTPAEPPISGVFAEKGSPPHAIADAAKDRPTHGVNQRPLISHTLLGRTDPSTRSSSFPSPTALRRVSGASAEHEALG
jgi:hypothetical protein